MPKEGSITADGFIQKVNLLRLKNKGKWVQAIEMVEGKMVEYKAYNTWIQILRIDGMNYPSLMDLKVRDYTAHLSKVLKGF